VTAIEVLVAGDRAVLVELADNDGVHAAATAARSRWGTRLEEAVPGERTLLLAFRDDRPALDSIRKVLAACADAPASVTGSDRHLTVPVRYDGEDLDEVAAIAGLAREQVIDLHTQAEYRVAFIGFAPGFGYLRGGDPRLEVPRRSTPRERVSAGSVAIAAGYCAVYPFDSPGGWQILGHTGLVMFDAARRPPALLEPGVRVSFEAL
jgi:KipI family sensor histidine kinase inhibitor